MSSPEALPDGEVHLHLTGDEADVSPRLIALYEAVLSPEERQRAGRFRFPHHRRQFPVARALLRFTLSHYHPQTAPQDWVFATTPDGRPYVAGGARLKLAFNLSHTRGRVALAIGMTQMMGVNVERCEKGRASLDVAKHFFAAAEMEALLETPAEYRHRRFFELWTLKEAYIKARGLGLSVPLNGFSITFEGNAGLSIGFGAGLDDQSTLWRLWSIDIGADHALALALALWSGERWSVRLFHGTPALEMSEAECRIVRSV